MPEPVKSSRWGAKTAPEAPKVAEVKSAPKPAGFIEYPKIVYRGEETRRVNNAQEEQQAAVEGFGHFVPAK